MADMSKYGNKYNCFSCGCKFYDLNRAVAICPKCGSDQAGAPKKAAPRKATVASRPPVEEEPEFESEEIEDAGGMDPDEFPTLDDTEDFDDDVNEDVSASFAD